MDYYPDNTLANFRVKLGKPIILDGPYEVALTEIIYPHRRLTVQPSEAWIDVVTTVKKKVDKPVDGKKKQEPKLKLKTTMKSNHSKKPVINKEAVRTNEAPRTKRKIVTESAVSRYTLPAGTYDTAQDLLKAIQMLTMDSGVFFNMDQVSGLFRVDLKNNVVKTTLSPRMAHMLGFLLAEEQVEITKSVPAQHLPHLDSTAHSLYIYTSIVDHQLVGNAVAPLLRVVCPDADKLGQTVSEKYIKPNYLPVSSSYIDTIDVQIRTTTGHLFPFLSGTPVVLTLHFVKQQHG